MNKSQMQEIVNYYNQLKKDYIKEKDEEKRIRIGFTINNLADFLNYYNKINNKNGKYLSIKVPKVEQNNSVLEDSTRYSVLLYYLMRELENNKTIESFSGNTYDKIKLSDQEIFDILKDFYNSQNILFSEDVLNEEKILTYKEKSLLMERYLGLNYLAGVFIDYNKNNVYGICKKNKTISDIFNINYIAAHGTKIMNGKIDYKEKIKPNVTYATYMDFLLADYLKQLGFPNTENIKTAYYYNLIKNAKNLSKYMSDKYTNINQMLVDLDNEDKRVNLYRAYDILYRATAISLYDNYESVNINKLLDSTSFKIEDFGLDDKDVIKSAKEINIKKRIRM